MIKTGIFWFNKDLRLDDNPALLTAAQQVDQLICIYILNQPNRLIEHQIGFSISENRQQFLYESLNDLNNSLQKLGQHLLVFTDNQKLDIADIVEKYQISHFFRSGDQH
jgi:deoxyribodipyrimidine photo-lyase